MQVFLLNDFTNLVIQIQTFNLTFLTMPHFLFKGFPPPPQKSILHKTKFNDHRGMRPQKKAAKVMLFACHKNIGGLRGCDIKGRN